MAAATVSLTRRHPLEKCDHVFLRIAEISVSENFRNCTGDFGIVEPMTSTPSARIELSIRKVPVTSFGRFEPGVYSRVPIGIVRAP